MREILIGENDAGQRLDKFLTKALPLLPPALLYKSIRLKKIKRNRKRALPADVLVTGDTLQLFLAEEFFPDTAKESYAHLAALRPSLSILYEDEQILLLNKPQGLSVHADEEGDDRPTLLSYLQAYLYQKGEYRPEEEHSFAPALCNRIDRNTMGIVIAAKTAEALRVMNEKIRDRQIEKFYLCAVHGTPSPREATLCGWLVKDEREKLVTVYDHRPPSKRDAREIRTRYRVLRTKGDLSLLEVELITGRTHQIRAHLAHVGYPLLGDGKYGQNRDDRKCGYNHQALCSYRLRFNFRGEPSCLDYLNHKEFRIPTDELYFMKEFSDA